MRFKRAVSPLLATIVLIAIVVSAGLFTYGIISSWFRIYGSHIEVQVAVDLVKSEDKALFTVSVKNAGSKPITGIVARDIPSF